MSIWEKLFSRQSVTLPPPPPETDPNVWSAFMAAMTYIARSQDQAEIINLWGAFCEPLNKANVPLSQILKKIEDGENVSASSSNRNRELIGISFLWLSGLFLTCAQKSRFIIKYTGRVNRTANSWQACARQARALAGVAADYLDEKNQPCVEEIIALSKKEESIPIDIAKADPKFRTVEHPVMGGIYVGASLLALGKSNLTVADLRATIENLKESAVFTKHSAVLSVDS